MRKRIVIALACLTAALMPPATASANISRLELGPEAKLRPEGTSVTIPVTYQCEFFDGTIDIFVDVAQSRGNQIAQGSGFANGPCTSSPQTLLIEVQSFSGVPFHQGKAVARASGSTFFPNFSSASDGPEEIQITR